tara:strand:- start:225 stop:374 length:150 start_codon:yes stop_codon:yes gene_type:complete
MTDKCRTYIAIFLLGAMMLVFIACARKYMTDKQFRQYQEDINQEEQMYR